MARSSARLAGALAALPALLFGVFVAVAPAGAERVSDVRNTRHNLSASGPGSVKAQSESQVCVFCHTPHGATPGVTPLWNRKLSGATYSVYTSASLDANAIQGQLDQPGGSSKLCLSCHDGSLAIGNVNVLNGQGSNSQQGTQSITMSGTGPDGKMPDGSGTTTGFTRNLGVDLTNDHPISLSYTNALAQRDGELRPVDASQKWPPGTGNVVGVRAPGYRPLLPLEPTGAGGTGQIQCATCHDPHLRETNAASGNQKFLRHNRFQESSPGPAYNQSADIICLSCHDKNLGAGTWAYSAHANPLVATQAYTSSAAAQREFPDGIPVWKAACLNCHDTHTVQGSRRLLREGTDSPTSPKTGGASAIEETCFQCHTNPAQSILAQTATVPDIRSDFNLPRRMPIRSTEQPAGTEVHDIGGGFTDPGFIDCTGPTNRCGADFIEPRSKLGVGNANNRHAECTDCHNPHRVVKFRSFVGSPPGSISGPPDPEGTHQHADAPGFIHSNIASGVLRGAWGVEPVYGASAAFHQLPTGYVVKRGDPGLSADTSVGATYVTREYQICLKCHSDYGYSDNNVYPTGTRPNLGYFGGTPSGTNNLTQYTNQAKEFQAPPAHKGEPLSLGADGGAAPAYNGNNHRSWHPVMDATGRTLAQRGISSGNPWRLPWSNAGAVGVQTMYCTDCHGSSVTSPTSVIPDGGTNGNPWGPHGSTNDFILKGTWSATSRTLCFKCHDRNVYSPVDDSRKSGAVTGFCCKGGNGGDQLHWFHWDKILSHDPGRELQCNWCHVAVPHGWKNKSLLVNLNDVGPEAGLAAGTQVRNNTTAYYNRGPYYMNALLKIRSFATSGNWSDSNCGSAGAPGNGVSGRDWMRDSSENCKNPP